MQPGLGNPTPVGIVYANHGRYLVDVDHEVSGHIGIKFSLDDLGGGRAERRVCPGAAVVAAPRQQRSHSAITHILYR